MRVLDVGGTYVKRLVPQVPQDERTWGTGEALPSFISSDGVTDALNAMTPVGYGPVENQTAGGSRGKLLRKGLVPRIAGFWTRSSRQRRISKA
jgi:hypothetical protein